MTTELVKITGLKKSEMNKVVKEVTGANNYKWYCKVVGDTIILGNDYFSDTEYYEIKSTEAGYVGAELNYYPSKVQGLLIDPSFSFSDYNEWCLEAFKKLVVRCLHHFNYCV